MDLSMMDSLATLSLHIAISHSVLIGKARPVDPIMYM